MYVVLLIGCIGMLMLAWHLEGKRPAAPGVILTFCLVLAVVFAIAGLSSWNTLSPELSIESVSAIWIGIASFLVAGQGVKALISPPTKSRLIPAGLDFLEREPNARFFGAVACGGLSLSYLWAASVSSSVGSTDFTAMASAIKAGGDDYEGSLETLIRCFTTAACLLSGITLGARLGLRRVRGSAVLFAAFVANLLPSAVVGVRTEVLHILVGIVAAFLMGAARTPHAKRTNFGVVLLSAIAAPLLVQVFFALSAVTSRDTYLSSPWAYFTYYLGSGIPAFDRFVAEGAIATGRIGETFIGVQDSLYRLGYLRTMHLPASKTWSWVYDGAGGVTNIYTVFRPALHDFGLVGMALYMGIFGAVFYLLYYGAEYGGKPIAFFSYCYLCYILVESMRDDFLSYWLAFSGLLTLFFLCALVSVSLRASGVRRIVE